MRTLCCAILFLVVPCLTTMGHAGNLPAEAGRKPLIVTTTPDLADITRRIAGEIAAVDSIASGKEDPHFLSARPGYILMARDADAWIRIGLELEVGWEDPILRDSRNLKIQQGAPGHIDASTGVLVLDVPEKRVTRDMGDVHPYGNPHYWLDPLNGRIAAKTIADRLGALFPDHLDLFQKNLTAFEKDLDERMFGKVLADRYGGAALWKQLLEKRLITTLEREGTLRDLKGWCGRLYPFEGASIVTYHRSWIYLTERFGLKLAVELEPKPGIPPGAKHLERVIGTVQQQNVKLILQEPFYSRKAADLVAARTRIAVVVCPNSVGGNEAADSYLNLMDFVIARIAERLEAR